MQVVDGFGDSSGWHVVGGGTRWAGVGRSFQTTGGTRDCERVNRGLSRQILDQPAGLVVKVNLLPRAAAVERR